MRIRQGNDFIFLWAIERNELPEDFSNAVNIRLHFKNFDCVGEVKSFQIVDGNIVRVEVSPEWASRLGAYRLILSYEFEDESYSDGDRKCVVDVLAFNIVPKTSEADDVTEMAKTTDIMIGLKGDKGDPFTYDDFTPEQIEDLKRPAIEAAESVLIVENQISINEQGRVQSENERETAETTRVSNENNRVTAEGLRVDAETTREQQEEARQTNTATAITNAENAITDVNTAKDDYYDVVKPAIQAQGVYAQEQGEFAQTEANKIPSLIAGKADKEQEEWITPTLLNGAENYGSGYEPVKFMKDSLGFVHIRGMIKNVAFGSYFFYLPIGYRPTEIVNTSGVRGGYFRIYPNGGIMSRNNITDFDSLQVIFKAEQ